MKSVGEVMAIGRTFEEALQKALRSLEIGRHGLGADSKDVNPTREEIIQKLVNPNADRVFYIKYALKAGFGVDEIYNLTKIDPWFIEKIKNIVEVEEKLRSLAKTHKFDELPKDTILEAKKYGFSDKQIAHIFNVSEKDVRRKRKSLGITTVFKMVYTCAAEFEAKTPYYYSTYEMDNNAIPTDKKKVNNLGSAPNTNGQGIEYEYSSLHSE